MNLFNRFKILILGSGKTIEKHHGWVGSGHHQLPDVVTRLVPHNVTHHEVGDGVEPTTCACISSYRTVVGCRGFWGCMGVRQTSQGRGNGAVWIYIYKMQITSNAYVAGKVRLANNNDVQQLQCIQSTCIQGT